MASSTQRLRSIHPLLAESHVRAIRVRISLRDSAGRVDRAIEGVVAEIATGKDGRARVRVSVPTGSGDPVDVRVLLETIDNVEIVSSADDLRASVVPVQTSRATISRKG
jgi:hypothetical protein